MSDQNVSSTKYLRQKRSLVKPAAPVSEQRIQRLLFDKIAHRY